MSLVITIVTPAGIVMAGDTRSSDTRDPTPTRKVYATTGGVGIGIAYDLPASARAALDLPPLLGSLSHATAREVADALHAHWSTAVTAAPDRVVAHVAAYHDGQAHVWGVDTREGVTRLMQPDSVGAAWLGEPNALMRLLQPVYKRNAAGEHTPIPHYPIPWESFTLAEVEDFAVFGIRTTERMLEYQRRGSVGGDVHVLTITPQGARLEERTT